MKKKNARKRKIKLTRKSFLSVDSLKNPKKPEESIRDLIAEQYPDVDLLFMSEKEYDEAILGVCDGISIAYKPKVAYSYEKVIIANMKMGMTYEESVEYFDYNQGGAYMGDHTPVFIR